MAQNQDIRFEHLSMDDGLSQSSVICMIQDNQGFIWFGTEDGLNKYDGYRITTYRHTPNDSMSLSSSNITVLLNDASGALWVGTQNGLNKFDYKTGRFTRYYGGSEGPENTGNNFIRSAYQDSHGTIWIGSNVGLYKLDTIRHKLAKLENQFLNPDQSYVFNAINEDFHNNLVIGTNHGLIIFDPESNSFETYTHNAKESNSLSNNHITRIIKNQSGNFWIGTINGLNEFHPETKDFRRYFYNQKVFSKSDRVWVVSLLEDSFGKIWVGADSGLIIFDKKNKYHNKYEVDPDNDQSLSYPVLNSIIEDNTGTIWIGEYGGIDKYDKSRWKFSHFKIQTNNNYEKKIRSFLIDKTGTLWVGSEGGRLNRFDRSPYFSNRYSQERSTWKILDACVASLTEDRFGNIWMGTWEKRGLREFDPAKETFHQIGFPGKYTLTNSLDGLWPWPIQLDNSKESLWVGTPDGPKRFDTNTRSFHEVIEGVDPIKGIKDNRIWTIYQQKEILWVGTDLVGLYRYDLKEKKVRQYQHLQNDPESLSNNYVTSIMEGNPGTLWIGTYGGGLNQLDTENQKFKCYTTAEGLPNNVVYGILKDRKGYLWLSTNKGISRFNPESETFRNYDVSDGLQSNEFNAGASYQSENGEMFFGGINGFNFFFPDSIKDNTHIPKIVFTDFQIFNQSLKPKQGSILSSHINETKEIVLNYDQSVFSFEFAALNYTQPEKNQYAYKLEGFSKDWQYIGNKRFITFTNLDPGFYTLRVKASNNDEVWNEEGISLNLTIRPPWWQTSWAYFLYGLLAIASLAGLILFVINRERVQKTREIEKLELKAMKEVDEIKSTLFANISHEFRTPLAVILGSLNQLKSNSEQKSKEQIRSIEQNAARSIHYIDQLLKLSSLQIGSSNLCASENDLVAFIKSMHKNFVGLAESRKIRLKLYCPYDTIKLYFDYEKLDNIFYNLLANSFKFTKENGEVFIGISKHYKNESNSLFKEGSVKIVIKDNGIGIPLEKLESIFDRFYQVDDSSIRPHEGMGIGLALCKELVQLHHGRINVKSEEYKHTQFTVELPLGKSHLKKSEITVDRKSARPGYFKYLLNPPQKADDENAILTELKEEVNILPKLLIVEDNAELRSHLAEHLSKDFEVFEALDGKQGLTEILKNDFDLVITDIMMPEMDGIEFCKKVKSNKKTSHIPVIMLTAKADRDSKIGGLKIGADDYIIKPFNWDELTMRAINLVSQRNKLKEIFKSIITLKPDEIQILSHEKEFLLKIKSIIQRKMDEKNVKEEDFKVDSLSKEIGMAKVTLTRKLKRLINMSPKQLITDMRLERAMQLIQNKSKANIADVAYAVGFNDPSSFSKYFKKKYGFSPSHFLRNT